jgi:hypothetical protein
VEVCQRVNTKKPPPKRWKRSRQKVDITYKPLLRRPCRARGASRRQAIPGPLKRGAWVKLELFSPDNFLDSKFKRNARALHFQLYRMRWREPIGRLTMSSCRSFFIRGPHTEFKCANLILTFLPHTFNECINTKWYSFLHSSFSEISPRRFIPRNLVSSKSLPLEVFLDPKSQD